ncbi:MAG TPA: DUF748 domain-containing protein, partial [Myxococcota bacterium]|nr:DUF748 domain-containing protein [Myxococcota bacterium]
TTEAKEGVRPLFAAREIRAHWAWGPLLHRVVEASAEVEAPEITVWRTGEKGAEPAKKGPPPDWQAQVRGLLPIKVDRIDVRDGVIRYRDPTTDPQLDLVVTGFEMHASNLTNRARLKDGMFAKVMVHGRPLRDGDFRMDMQLDPLAETPTLTLQAKLQAFELTRINDLLRAYGNFDVSQGQFAMFMEVATKKGQFEGYVKPMFTGLDVRTWEDEVDRKHPLKLLWRELVSLTVGLVKNDDKDQVATKVPFEGKLDDPDVGVWDATVALLRNGFVRALLPGLDHSVALSNLPKKS